VAVEQPGGETSVVDVCAGGTGSVALGRNRDLYLAPEVASLDCLAERACSSVDELLGMLDAQM
jgi:hypothetical protein